MVAVIMAGSGHAQTITTTAGSVTSCPGEIQVPVNVTNCNGIGAISLVLNFDNTRLTYLGYTNLNSALTVGMLIINGTGNKVVISWINTTAANLGNSTMVQLRFSSVPSTTNLTWDTQTPGNCEYTDINGNILPSAYTNGTATINQPPAISTQPVNSSVMVGQNTSFSLSASGAGLTYIWQLSTNGGTTWGDLANNTVYSGVTSPTMYITNVLLTYNGYKYRCKITGTCTPLIYTSEVFLYVTNPVTTTLPTASFCPGNIIVPVTVTNFTGVAAFSLTFGYNPNLTYTGFQTLNGALSGGTFVINASGGKVYMTWTSTTAATIGNGTIVELLFTAASGTSPLAWDLTSEGNCEYSALSGSAITSVFVNGSETIYSIPVVTAHPASVIVAKGLNTSFSISATGTGLAYLWQVSSNGGLSFSDLTNSSYYTNVTTPTLNITGAQLAISGYQYRCRVTGTCTPVVYSNTATLTVLPNIISNLGSSTVCPGQVIIPITVTDFIGVASFSLAVNFNTSVLTFTGVQNLNAALTSGTFVNNASNGKVYLTWTNLTAATIAGGGTLCELKFTGVPGTSALTWDTQTTGNCEYSDVNGLIIFSSWNNGSATINTPPAITAQPANATIYSGGSATFSVTGSGTGPGYLWQVSTNGGLSFTNLTNVTPYSGVNSNVLTINPAATGMNGYLYHCIVSGTCTPSVTSNTGALTVTQAAITTTPGTVTNSCTGNLSIPVNVTNFNGVGGISLAMVFDTTKMSFQGYQSLNAALTGGLLTVNRSANKVYMTWASTTAATIGSGALIQFRFRANAGISTTLSWDTQTPGACEYSDISGNIITSFFSTSTVSTVANALIVNAGPDMIKTGSSVQLNGTATGGTLPYSWLWSPATGLSNPAIANPVASPTVTTTYTLTVTATGCTGIDMMDVIVSGPPTTLTIQGVTIPSGTTLCYNATSTITVAGSGTTFTIQSGGSATMIAGQKISYLPGTVVQSGGYMHGYITTNGQYCNTTVPPVMEKPAGLSDFAPATGSHFRVYPNPTTGVFTVERSGDPLETAEVRCYGIMGNLLFSSAISGELKKQFSLADRPTGVYFIRISQGELHETMKIIRQ